MAGQGVRMKKDKIPKLLFKEPKLLFVYLASLVWALVGTLYTLQGEEIKNMVAFILSAVLYIIGLLEEKL